ncbi:hypothetical protein LAG90_19010 [Marinilongibacter aquaticus]|uniref:hypothetical protein n=1 Tax=Marinilongibacter aquaticus TaxID=2975157 RepID=UPI0021BD8A78|nr:hypothetical protein [Marinilongibacter aquaticus]UBM58891.1 hypothetical protein LAG90_19010 [Marinilongibacter aquaticus]
MKTFTILFLLSFAAFAQKPSEMTARFFETYESGESIKALEELYANSPWLERIRDDVEKLKTQFADLPRIVGSYNDKVLLYEKTVSDCFLIASYLVKYDRQPVRMTFEYYKPKSTWYLYSFSYDDDFLKEFKETLKYKNLESLSD